MKVAMLCFNVSKRLFLRIESLFPARLLSTRAIGNNFELFTVKTLAKYRFEVWCCGGPSDRGVDFRGIWNLKTCKVNILGQCKCYKRRLGPVHIRELEGTLSHEQHNTLGMIVTNRGFTKDAYQHFMSSAFPLALTVLEYTHLNYVDLETLSAQDSLIKEADSAGIDEWSIDSISRGTKSTNIEPSLHGVKSNSDSNEHHSYFNNATMTTIRSSRSININSQTSYNNIDSDFVQETLNPQVECDIHMNNTGESNSALSGRDFKLFDLNMAARCLVPSVVIGQTVNKYSNNGSPTILLLENETITTIT